MEAYLQDLFEEDDGQRKNVENLQDTEDAQFKDEGSVHRLPTAGNEDLIRSNNSASEDWISRSGAQDRSFKGTPWRERTADVRASRTDRDTTPMGWSGNARKLGYQTHYVIDGGKSCIILSVLVTPGEVTENRPMLALLWRTAFRWKLSLATSPVMANTKP